MILELVGKEGELNVTEILKKNPNKQLVSDIQKYSQKLAMHNKGTNFEKYIERMDYFEKPNLLELRKKYSPKNIDVLARLHRPLDKIYTAKGSSVLYYMDSELEKDFIAKVSNVYEGDSLRQWNRKYWFDAVNYDPMGVILMEVGDNEVYPTYQTSELYFDVPYPEGRCFDYMVFNMPELTAAEHAKGGTDKYYRVLDDKSDRTIKWDGETAIVVEEFPNYFDDVPAITLSWIYDPIRKWYVSPDHPIVDALDDFMRERSVYSMFMMHHGFPMKYMMGMACPTCKGSGGRTGDTCPSCSGTGIKAKMDVAETITIKAPRSKDVPILKAEDIAGYIAPPVDSIQHMIDSIMSKYKDMHYTMWGTQLLEDSADPQTATGRFIDVQPVNDKLIGYSEAAEYVEMWELNMMGSFYYGERFQTAVVNLGRRYMIESPDKIWEKYQLSRKQGGSQAALNTLYLQWLETEFQNNEHEYREQYMRFLLEPWPHNTIAEVLAFNLPPLEFYKKAYFQSWLNQLPENIFLVKDYTELAAMRDTYIEGLGVPEVMPIGTVPNDGGVNPNGKHFNPALDKTLYQTAKQQTDGQTAPTN